MSDKEIKSSNYRRMMFQVPNELAEKIEMMETFTEENPEYVGVITRHDIVENFCLAAISMYGEKIGRKWYEFTNLNSR